MKPVPTVGLAARRRQRAQDAVVAAARSLLSREQGEGFTMKDLAEAAKVSLATPYNHFGSKGGVLRAVVYQALASIAERFKDLAPADDAPRRVMILAELGADILLADGDVIRAAGRALTMETSGASIFEEAARLWELAIQTDFPFRREIGNLGAPALARQLAVMFRGMLAFWISAEVDDAGFRSGVLAGAATVVLAFVEPRQAGAVADYLGQLEAARR